WIDNFDGTLKEPLLLPSKVPNLLVNGSAGIAVGMATNMPPHNLGEVADALLLLLAHPNTSLDDVMKVLPGPDFPTGGYVSTEGIREAYETGRGMIHLRGSAGIRERGGKDEIVITETPYEVNKAALLELIADLVKGKRIDGITDLRDESDRRGTSVVLELRRDAPAEIVLNRLHLLEGFLTAIDHIDEVIRIIRRSKDVQVAETNLMGKFLLSSEQAKAILDMRLARLTALER